MIFFCKSSTINAEHLLVKVLNNLVEILDNIGLYNSAFTGKEANCRCLDADFKKN